MELHFHTLNQRLLNYVGTWMCVDFSGKAHSFHQGLKGAKRSPGSVSGFPKNAPSSPHLIALPTSVPPLLLALEPWQRERQTPAAEKVGSLYIAQNRQRNAHEVGGLDLKDLTIQ